VDVDRFVASNQPAWHRLQELTDRAGRGVGRLQPAELDELVDLYQRVSTHLSLARSTYHEPALTSSLTGLTARAGAVVYGTRPRTLRAARRFFAETFPAALWHIRWLVVVATALTLVPALIMAAWLPSSPRILDAAAPAELRESYVEEDFANYYSDTASAEFAASVATNNIQVAFLAFALGILACYGSVVLLVLNGANLGFAAGLLIGGNQAGQLALILPHGFLELSAIFIAGAAGLRLGWTLIDPGDRPRGAALVEEGRRSVAVIAGLVVVFVVAGLIEGFVTREAWIPLPAQVAVGFTVWAAFVAYVVVCGRAATSRGLTGAIGEQDDAGWATVTR